MLIFVLISVSLCGCTVKKNYNSIDDYKIQISDIAAKYGFDIKKQSSSINNYVAEISDGNQYLIFSFNLGDDEQYNSFDFSCENPQNFNELLEIINCFSRKELNADKYYEVIENEQPFLNVDENYVDKSIYSIDRLNYLDLTEDYAVEYTSTINGDTEISFAGFTK